MTDTFDSLARDTVASARVPAGHAEREVRDLVDALRSIATASRLAGLDDGEVADEAQRVASVTRGALVLRYAGATTP